jgi:hypothetical protein
MAAGEKEGKKAWERRRGRSLGEKEMEEDRRGREEEEEATFVRSGRGSRDHVHFF